MKVVQINSFCGSGSTGKICVSISGLLNHKGIENYIFYTSGVSDYASGKRYMSPWEIKWNAAKSRVLGNWGFNSASATTRLIAELENIQPDIVHLHNLHSHNVQLEILLSYLKEKKTRIIWTFHDCWVFTGYCPHYDMIGCEQWKVCCKKCPQKKHYSWFLDRSSYVYKKKNEVLDGANLTIVTPSKWLAEQVKQSFLKNYPVKVIYNGVDLDIFKPRKSNFRKKHGLEDKFVLLGVAFGWGIRKGLDIFVELSRRLEKHFQIVLVGTDTEVDKKLPENIISIHRTQNQIELAEIYTAADLFVNPTREEVLGLVNIESLACGTPVVTFNTGGSPECINEACGCVIGKNDIDYLIERIKKIYDYRPYSEEVCIAKAKEFDKTKKNYEYLKLYLGTNI